jgi:hypothetical protein
MSFHCLTSGKDNLYKCREYLGPSAVQNIHCKQQAPSTSYHPEHYHHLLKWTIGSETDYSPLPRQVKARKVRQKTPGAIINKFKLCDDMSLHFVVEVYI